MPKQKQIEKAKETLEIYAPIAHRLGIHAIKWELEDLAFADAAPAQVPGDQGAGRPAARRARALRRRRPARYLAQELEALGIEAEISGRAKHFYSIYSKMTKKGREFNEIYDLTAMRVIVDSVKDCYGAVGVIHSLWKPLPGRFKDFIAMPKFNLYQSLHTTVIGPEGRPLEIQIRTREMHDMAEFGVAAHWMYKAATGGKRQGARRRRRSSRWLRSMLDWQQELSDPQEFMDTSKVDLFEDEVFVFTPKGEVKSLAAGATPLDFAYEVHTEVGHRCVGREGQRQDRAAALRAAVGRHRRGPHLQARARPLARLARDRQDDARAQQDQAVVQGASRARTPSTPAASCCRSTCARQGLPAQKITGSPLLADVIREMGFRKADDFYIALGGGEDLAEGRRQQGHAAPQAGRGRGGSADRADDLLEPSTQRRRGRPAPRRSSASASRASTT